MRLHSRWTLPAVLLAAMVAPATADAQAVTLDEGAFRVLVAGAAVGTETFLIRRSGTGDDAVTIAQGRIVVDTVGAQEIETTLEVKGPVLRPTGYQVNVRGAERLDLAGRMVGGRFSAKVISPRGETMREYLASEGAVIADEGVAHHYFFLARRLDQAPFTVPVIVPRQSRQVSARVAVTGTETLRIGGKTVQARRVLIQPTGGPERIVWVDAEERVLRLEIPDRALVAERVALP